MHIGKIILAVAISVVSFFSASAAGRHGLITLKTGEQIEAPEVWFTHGQAIYLMSSKDKKVVIEDSEIDYVQYYDEEKKDFGDKEYSEYMITSYEFLKENPKMPKTRCSGFYKVFDIDGYILYAFEANQFVNGHNGPMSNFQVKNSVTELYFKKPEWPWVVGLIIGKKDFLRFYKKILEDNAEMSRLLDEKGMDFFKPYTDGIKSVEDINSFRVALLKDYVETRDKK